MAQPDDQSMERTSAEAERLLGDLNQILASGDSSPAGWASEKGSGLPPQKVSPSGPWGSPASWLLLDAFIFGTMVAISALLLLIKLPERSRSPGRSQVSTPDRRSVEPTPERQPETISTDLLPTTPRDRPGKEHDPELRFTEQGASGRAGSPHAALTGPNTIVSSRIGILVAKEPGSQINVRERPGDHSFSPHYGLAGDRVSVIQQATGDDGLIWFNVLFPKTGATGWIRGNLIHLLN